MLLVTHDQVDAHAPSPLADRTAMIGVSCANLACQNSMIASQRLIELGYTDAHVDAGGKQNWIDTGYPTERGLLNHVA